MQDIEKKDTKYFNVILKSQIEKAKKEETKRAKWIDFKYCDISKIRTIRYMIYFCGCVFLSIIAIFDKYIMDLKKNRVNSFICF